MFGIRSSGEAADGEPEPDAVNLIKNNKTNKLDRLSLQQFFSLRPRWWYVGWVFFISFSFLITKSCYIFLLNKAVNRQINLMNFTLSLSLRPSMINCKFDLSLPRPSSSYLPYTISISTLKSLQTCGEEWLKHSHTKWQRKLWLIVCRLPLPFVMKSEEDEMIIWGQSLRLSERGEKAIKVVWA